MAGLGRTTRLPPSACPYCGHAIDCVTVGPGESQDATPRPGDITICIRCSAILAFDPLLAVRKPTADELEDAAGMRPAQVVLQALAELHGRERRQ